MNRREQNAQRKHRVLEMSDVPTEAAVAVLIATMVLPVPEASGTQALYKGSAASRSAALISVHPPESSHVRQTKTLYGKMMCDG